MGRSHDSYGRLFSQHGQYGLAALMNSLDDLSAATLLMQDMSDDELASVRRVAICTPDPAQSLITPSLLRLLEADTVQATGDRHARRRAYWAARC
jgi:hypothetical protein